MPKNDRYLRAYRPEVLAEEAEYLRSWPESDVWWQAQPASDPLTIDGFDTAVARFELQRREKEAAAWEKETRESHAAFEQSWSRLENGFNAIAAREAERRQFAADQERRRKHAIKTQQEVARQERHDHIYRMLGES